MWCDHVEHPLFRNVGRILGHKNKPLPTPTTEVQKPRRPSREDLDEVIHEADAAEAAHHEETASSPENKDIEMESASPVVSNDVSKQSPGPLAGIIVQNAPLPAEHPLRDDHVE